MASYDAGASASTSSDPYAQFYYWDVATNNWAFDYDRYYATYGYPTADNGAAAEPAPGYDNAAYAAHQASLYGGSNDAFSTLPTAGMANGSTTEKRKKFLAGPKDADGNPIAGSLRKGELRTTVLRKAPGNHLYEDQTLLEWDPTHKRLFVGDLGGEVTDAMLAKAFEKYASFSKARVVRNKGMENKSKGYGFVAFGDPHDFLKAWKEMDGKHIGSRPCRIKKASEDTAPVQIGLRKDRLLAANAKYDAFKSKTKMGGAIGGQLRRHGIGKAWKQK